MNGLIRGRYCLRARRLLLALLIALSLASCEQLAESSVTEPEPLRIGGTVWPGYEPLYLAETLGYFDDLPVKMVNYPSASEVIRAYRNGAIKAAALTMDEVLLLAESGFEPRVVLILDVSYGGDVILAREGINHVTDLKGKHVGAENSAVGAYLLSRALSMNGMSMSDVILEPLEVYEHEVAFADGLVDAVVTYEPERTRVLGRGAREIFSSKEIPGEIIDVLVVDEDYMARNPAIVKRWFKTLTYQQEHLQEAASIIARRQLVRPAEYLAAMEGLTIPDHAENSLAMRGVTQPVLETIARLQKTMVENKLLQKEVDITALVDASAL